MYPLCRSRRAQCNRISLTAAQHSAGQKTPPIFIYGGAFGNAVVGWLFCTLLECSGKIVILQTNSCKRNDQRRTNSEVEGHRMG